MTTPATRPLARVGWRPGTVRAAGALTLALVLAGTALASRLLWLARDEALCDERDVACLDASLSYDVNGRLLWLRGRVTAAPGPGLFTILVRGTNRLGHVRYAPLEVELRGRTSEIVDHRMIPDHPDVDDWAIHRITFAPAPAQ